MVVSPPSGEIETVDDVREGRRKAYELVEEKGLDGGMLITHLYRIKDEYEDDMTWYDVREKEDWREYVKYSPHFHIIGYPSRIEPHSEEDDWVVKKIAWVKLFDKKETEDGYKETSPLVNELTYLLSHCATFSDVGLNIITWFGSLSFSTWSVSDCFDVDMEKFLLMECYKNIRKIRMEKYQFRLREVAERGGLNLVKGDYGKCEREDCDGQRIHISHAKDYLYSERRRGVQIDLEKFKFYDELYIAYQWHLGNITPDEPCRSEEEAEEFVRRETVERFGASAFEN